MREKAAEMPKTLFGKIDESTLLPISFVIVIGALFYWAATLQSANSQNQAKIDRLSTLIETSHLENLRRHDQTQQTLMEIYRTVGKLEGRTEPLSRE